MMNFSLKPGIFAFKTRNFALKTMNFADEKGWEVGGGEEAGRIKYVFNIKHGDSLCLK